MHVSHPPCVSLTEFADFTHFCVYLCILSKISISASILG